MIGGLMMGSGGSPAGTDTKLGLSSSFFPVLLFSAFFASFPFALAEMREAFELVTANGGSSINPAKSAASRLLTNPSSNEENAPGSPASGAGIPMEPALLVVGDDDATCKTVARFTP